MARGEGGIKKNKFLKWNVLAHHGVISSIGLIRVLKRATYGNTCSLSSTKRLTWTSIHYNICYPTIWCQWCQQYSYNNSYSSEALQALTAYLYIIMLFVKKEFSCKSDQQFTEIAWGLFFTLWWEQVKITCLNAEVFNRSGKTFCFMQHTIIIPYSNTNATIMQSITSRSNANVHNNSTGCACTRVVCNCF